MLSLFAEVVHWSLAPVLDFLYVMDRLYKSVFCGNHILMLPFRLTMRLIQWVICAQVVFTIAVAMRMLWGVVCTLLCMISSFVASHAGANTLTNFFELYFWPI